MKLVPLCLAVLLFSSCSHSLKNETMEALRSVTEKSEIGTVEYTLRKVIKLDDKATWYKYGDRKILFSATAYLKAGVDMKDFDFETLSVDTYSKSISVTLPRPKILSFRMPEEEIHEEYCRVSGLRSEFTPEQKLELKQQGEKAILAEVSEMGVLDEAAKNAEAMFTAIFTQLGYQHISVKFK